ncbi:hypothetical protein JCM8115_002446 [Rhodotorula mucilaginosa]
MATTPPTSTAHDRSAPPSDSSASLPTSSSSATAPAPLAIPSAGTQQPSSALSASLKGFRELAAVHKGASENAVETHHQQQQHPFATDEFKQAYHHARRTSFGQQAGGTQQGLSPGHAGPLPALSTSPSTSSDAGTSAGSLPTPPSSSPPPTTTKPRASTTQTTNGGTNTATNGNSLKQKKPSSTLGGVCEAPEIALENGQLGLSDQDLLGVPISSSGSTVTASPPPSTQTGAGTGMFSGGAKWGWTSSSSSSSAAASPGTTSPAALASPPIGSVGSAFAPMSLPVTGALGGPGGGDSDLLSPTHRRRGSISFATPATTTAGGGSSSVTTAVTSAAGTGIPIPTSASNGVTSPLATSPPTNDPFRMMQPLTRVVSAGAALQTPNAAKNGSAKSTSSSGAADGFGLFRRFSIGGLGARKTRPAPAQPPSPPSSFGNQHQHQLGGGNTSSNLPAPTLLEPTHASLSPATISTTEAKAKPPPPPGVRGRTLAPAGVGGGGGTGGGGTKPRKLSPMGERILRGGY